METIIFFPTIVYVYQLGVQIPITLFECPAILQHYVLMIAKLMSVWRV